MSQPRMETAGWGLNFLNRVFTATDKNGVVLFTARADASGLYFLSEVEGVVPPRGTPGVDAALVTTGDFSGRVSRGMADELHGDRCLDDDLQLKKALRPLPGVGAGGRTYLRLLSKGENPGRGAPRKAILFSLLMID